MTREEHKARHVELHRAFDELLADYLLHNRGALPSTTTCMELAEWSNRQQTKPDEESATVIAQ